jgi:hypothetical protein
LCSRTEEPKEYDTFEHYYGDKYGLRNLNPNAPLIRAKRANAKVTLKNLLRPAGRKEERRTLGEEDEALASTEVSAEGAEGATGDVDAEAPAAEEAAEGVEDESTKWTNEYLIPELCRLYWFPAQVIRSLEALPCLLYRVEVCSNRSAHSIENGIFCDLKWQNLNGCLQSIHPMSILRRLPSISRRPILRPTGPPSGS